MSDIDSNRILPNPARESNLCKEGQLATFITKARKAEKEYAWQQEGLSQAVQQRKCGLVPGALVTKDT